MIFMSFALVLFILAVIQFVLDKMITKNDEKISHTDGCIPYRWFMVIGTIVVISLAFFDQESYRYICSGVLLILIFGVRSIFEWKYIRSSKKHVMSLLMMGISLVGTVVYVLM